MQREIFINYAYVVDANGTYNSLSGYPKTFDSKNYSNDIEKAKNRALSDIYGTLSDMLKVDTRQLQNAIVVRASDGITLFCEGVGSLTTPDPEVG